MGGAQPAIPFGELAAKLVRLALAVQPAAYLGPDEEGGTLSRLRGNLALLFTNLCERQSQEGAPPVLQQLDLSPLVVAFIHTLKKERGAAQHNIGVCVTRLAQSPR